MTAQEQAELLNRFPEVRWDRLAGDVVVNDFAVFGWIARDDGRSDFVALIFTPDGQGLLTSSARYSADFFNRLGGNPDDHEDCARVEHVYGNLVPGAIRLPATEIPGQTTVDDFVHEEEAA